MRGLIFVRHRPESRWPSTQRHVWAAPLPTCPLQLDACAIMSTLLCVGTRALPPRSRCASGTCGGEGQILMGGLTAALSCMMLPGQQPAAAWLLFAADVRCGSIAAGALWGFIPACVQGQLEHQRDAVHPDDELRCNVDLRLHVPTSWAVPGDPAHGHSMNKRHGTAALASRVIWGISAIRSTLSLSLCSPSHVRLPALHQAWL